MAFWSNLVARLSGKSHESDEAPVIDPARLARVMKPALGTTHDELLQQVFDGMSVAQPKAGRVPSTAQASEGPLALELEPAERMKIWLSQQRPEVVDAVADSLNWDEAEDVILWILQQKTTDAATAVKLFMKSQPAYYILDGVDPPDGFAKSVIDTFSSHWIAGLYARGTVGYDPSTPTYSDDDLLKIYGTTEVKDQSGKIIDFKSISDLRQIEELRNHEALQRPLGKVPWPPLEGLEGPFDGPKPLEHAAYFKHDRQGLFTLRFLLGGLGTWLIGEEFDEPEYKNWLMAHGFADDAE